MTSDMVMCWLLHTWEVSGVLVWGIGRSIISIVKRRKFQENLLHCHLIHQEHWKEVT